MSLKITVGIWQNSSRKREKLFNFKKKIYFLRNVGI